MGIRISHLRIRIILSLTILMSTMDAAQANNFTLHLGPSSVGRGGPNPLSIPPSITDIGLLHLGGDSGTREIYISVTPGLFLWGYRIKAGPGPYAALGGGIVSSANGIALGAYTAAGWDFACGFICFNIEYRGAIGVASGRIINPYSVRAGISYWY